MKSSERCTTPWTHDRPFESTDETSVSTFGIEPATVYEFRVQAQCPIGDSELSDAAAFDTDPVGECGVPQNLVTSDITADSAVLKWEDILEARSYTVAYR